MREVGETEARWMSGGVTGFEPATSGATVQRAMIRVLGKEALVLDARGAGGINPPAGPS